MRTSGKRQCGPKFRFELGDRLLFGFVETGGKRTLAEHVRVLCDHVEHVTVVRSVVAHLDQYNSIYAAWVCMIRNLLWQETRTLHLRACDSRSNRILFEIVGPDVDVASMYFIASLLVP